MLAPAMLDRRDFLRATTGVTHSRPEKRYRALGQTEEARYLFVAFRIRRYLIRVISLRDINRKEREVYWRYEKRVPGIRSENEEREFWVIPRFHGARGLVVGPPRETTDLKLSLCTISVRLP